MRIAALAFSAVLLSGCSWLGLGGQQGHQGSQYNQQGRYHAGGQAQRAHNPYAQNPYARAPRRGPCEIVAASQPVPQGCSPEQVTIAIPHSAHQGAYGAQAAYGGGYSHQGPQTPGIDSYGHSKYDANRNAGLVTNVGHKHWQRPRLRLNGSLGFETSVSGTAFSASDLANLYDPITHTESFLEGSPAALQTTRTTYFAQPGSINPQAPSISFSDMYSAPITTSVGAEYQMTDRLALFGNASYAHAGGGKAGGVLYEGDLSQTISVQDYIETRDPVTGAITGYAATGAPLNNTTTLVNEDLARSQFEVNDMKRGGVEVGVRHYFKDAFAKHLERPLTPFVAASAGGAHYNELSVKQSQENLYLSEYWNSDRQPEDLRYFEVADTAPVELLEKGWVPTGAITVGAEWQVTPRAALGFETGVRYEGGRKVTAGGETDANVSIPLTLRGSIGF